MTDALFIQLTQFEKTGSTVDLSSFLDRRASFAVRAANELKLT